MQTLKIGECQAYIDREKKDTTEFHLLDITFWVLLMLVLALPVIWMVYVLYAAVAATMICVRKKTKTVRVSGRRFFCFLFCCCYFLHYRESSTYDGDPFLGRGVTRI